MSPGRITNKMVFESNERVAKALEMLCQQEKPESGEATLAVVINRLDTIDKKLDQALPEIDRNDHRITKLEGKVDSIAVVQGLFSTLAATLAGYLGIKH